MEHWKFSESLYEEDCDFGSGYPSDPKCKAWMTRNLTDQLFCYPDLVRFSWGPVKDACKSYGHAIQWEADDDNDNDDEQQKGAMTAFLTHGGGNVNSSANNNKKPRLAYFESRKLKRVTKLTSHS